MAALSPQVTESRAALARFIRAAHRDTAGIEREAIEWRSLVDEACDAWLGGVLLEAVERHGWSVPPPPLAKLRWQAIEIRRSNAWMLGELSRVVRALERRGVEVLLLKGADLNLTLYAGPGLRPMSDLDLLVRPEAVGRAMAALEGLGFRRGPGLVRGDFFPRFHYEVEYSTQGDRPARVDLHVRAFRPLRYAQTVPDAALWDRSHVVETDGARVLQQSWVLRSGAPLSSPLQKGGKRGVERYTKTESALVPALEEKLIHLATHSACHGHCRLIWLYDICRLVDLHADSLDWDRVAQRCRLWGLALPVRETMRRLEYLWGPMGLDHVHTVLRRAETGWRDRLCLAQAPHDAKRPLRHVAVNLLCTSGLRFRLAYLAAVLIPGREHIGQVYRWRHPGWLFCGHIRRWLRALAGVMRHVWAPLVVRHT